MDGLLDAVWGYLSGRTTFQALHTTALDLLPELADDPVASELAARIVAAAVEAGDRAGEELALYRKSAVRQALNTMETRNLQFGEGPAGQVSNHSITQTIVVEQHR